MCSVVVDVCWMGRGTHGQLAALRWVTVTLWVRPPLLAYLLLFSASVGENVCRELRESSCLMGTSLARGGTSQNLACAAYRSFFFGHHMGARGQRRVTQSEKVAHHQTLFEQETGVNFI